jgi:hypothetical protein
VVVPDDGLTPQQRIEQAQGIWVRWVTVGVVILVADLAYDIALGWRRNPWESWLLLASGLAIARAAEQRGWLAGYRAGRAST